uniref:Serum response factor-binding protein 1 n=1 Tax=Denticeps clupeoides TaxID=299321 RepID=A0AAY4E324_9TELE
MNMPTVLNLSREVVKMRSEVKRVRVLIIRKLTRQISALKKKKGTEADLQRNQRRVTRLLEEIHELRVLAPDTVTKAALQKDISFEKVCQNPQAGLSERATARIVTHPQFSKKIRSIKDAIKAFKEERISAAKSEKRTKKEAEELAVITDAGVEGSAESEPKERDASRSSLLLRTQSMEVKPAKPPVTQPGLQEGSSELEIAPNSPRKHESPVKKTVKDVPLPKSKQVHQPERKKPEQENEEEEEEHESESDLESSEDEEEKEYFDDSTEERFHKQSSQSEESDHDDFFLGKVSKFKKRKSDPAPGPQKEKARGQEGAIQKQDLGPARLQSVFSSWVKSRGPEPPFERKQNHRPAPGKTLRPPQTTQQALHPSWEASRKRKEQQGQIAAFQGKKIKFDDDDD